MGFNSGFKGLIQYYEAYIKCSIQTSGDGGLVSSF